MLARSLTALSGYFLISSATATTIAAAATTTSTTTASSSDFPWPAAEFGQHRALVSVPVGEARVRTPPTTSATTTEPNSHFVDSHVLHQRQQQQQQQQQQQVALDNSAPTFTAPAPAPVWVTVPWNRRRIPDADATNVVLTVAATGEVVRNVVRAPVHSPDSGQPVASREALSFVFEPVPAPPPGDDVWIPNNGTATENVVTNCSGAQRSTLACWKAVDGVLEFSDAGGAGDAGWDGAVEPGTVIEWLEVDLGATAAGTVDRVGIYSVSSSDDPLWFPVHDPANVSVLTRNSDSEPWSTLFSGTIPAGNFNKVTGWNISESQSHFRFEIHSRHVQSQAGSHSYIKEVRFGHGPPPGPAPPPTLFTDYALYYMPFSRSGSTTGLSLQDTYDPVNHTADPTWRAANNLTDGALSGGQFRTSFQQVDFVGIESRTSFDAFDTMEVVANASAVDMLAEHAASPIVFFPTDRRNQVKMKDDIPQLWVKTGPSTLLNGSATQGEIYALQAGFWSPDRSTSIFIDGPNGVQWSSLSLPATQGAVEIPASKITCYNTRGVDYRGDSFVQDVSVPAGGVGSLWFSVDVDSTQPVGVYTGNITVTAMLNGTQSVTTTLTLAVSVTAFAQNAAVLNGGVDDAWRMSRLSWLDSTLGIDRNTTSDGDRRMAPVSLQTSPTSVIASLDGGRVLSWGVNLGGAQVELLQSVSVSPVLRGNLTNVLSSPIIFAAADVLWESASSSVSVVQSDNMTATLNGVTRSTDGKIILNSSFVVSYDGFVDIELALSSTTGSNVTLPNTSLEFSFSHEASTYFMGLGVEGRDRRSTYPNGVSWKWADNSGGENQFWAGSTTAGLRLKLKGNDFNWESPLHMQTAAPTSWAGDAGGGGCSALPSTDGTLKIQAFSGPLTVSATPTVFKFDVLVTPIKTLNTARHFRRDRYYQYGYNGEANCEQIAQMGVKVLNLHQGVGLNPYINYPFVPESMANQANFSRQCKALGVESTKIYYTTRELSNRCYEMPTLQMIAGNTDSVFDSGTGGGGSWLQEHLQSDYHVRWSTGLADGSIDEAIADTSLSRWVNYYVEGLQWLSQDHLLNSSSSEDSHLLSTSAIDGVYLDEVSFDRSTVQRMRKAVDRYKSGNLFDLHSCNKFHCGVPAAPHACSALIYMAHFVFLDSLWFGEGFSPDYPPDQWLVEMSGIPFGMHAEQLSNPNLQRGMVFAEGARPAPNLWKAWDSLGLTSDGIVLVGWWDNFPAVSVTSVGSQDPSTEVYASAYLRTTTIAGTDSTGGVIAVASWDNNNVQNVQLHVDWSAFGLTVDTAAVTASPIEGFQPGLEINPTSPTLAIPAAGGWLLNVSRKK